MKTEAAPPETSTPEVVPTSSRWKAPVLLLSTALLTAALLAAGLVPRLLHRAQLEKLAAASPDPIVNVATAVAGDAGAELTLPSSVEAQQSTPIYPRVNGYVKTIVADIGAKVKAGDLLAEIETPELDEQVNVATATLAQARANLKIAQTTSERWNQLGKSRVVAPQEVDERQSAMEARTADLAAAEATLQRLTRQRGFQKIIAPFDGTVTQRHIEVGQLVTGDLNDEIRVLYRMEQLQTLRAFVNVPQSYYRFVSVGQSVDLSFKEVPGRTFPGKVVRTAGSLDAATRTLRTEIHVSNDAAELVPGLFAEVKFKVQREQPPITIPARALILQTSGPQVATLGADNKVLLASVVISRDLGKTIELSSGLPAGTRFVANPNDTLRDGTTVAPAAVPANPTTAK
ncbi:MAG: efflux RND transporter periplasmic adaptor subunit [Chthoniobacter sp.]|uniref:efflux RND transporter periplasmic adaptor subunit n=1 Tax=Chthoniobacter sp. TaxID=2510640 RepID=UPI0032A314D7